MTTEPDSAPAEDALATSTQDNLEVIANLAEAEDAHVGPLRARLERLSSVFGTPGYFVFALVFIVGWIAVNLWGEARGWRHYDEAPFFWLQGIVSSHALLLTILVLIRQDRMAHLAAHRAHLDLQINMLTERKITKTLEVIARLHPEHRAVSSDGDDLDELIEPADAEAIMEAIKRNDGRAVHP